jgi:hypothetical protein
MPLLKNLAPMSFLRTDGCQRFYMPMLISPTGRPEDSDSAPRVLFLKSSAMLFMYVKKVES